MWNMSRLIGRRWCREEWRERDACPIQYLDVAINMSLCEMDTSVATHFGQPSFTHMLYQRCLLYYSIGCNGLWRYDLLGKSQFRRSNVIGHAGFQEYWFVSDASCYFIMPPDGDMSLLFESFCSTKLFKYLSTTNKEINKTEQRRFCLQKRTRHSS